MKTNATFQSLATGGRNQRDMADIRMQSTAHIGYVCNTAFSGPLDAPEAMPAGSVLNTECTNWRGKAIISQSEFTR